MAVSREGWLGQGCLAGSRSNRLVPCKAASCIHLFMSTFDQVKIVGV